MKPPQHFQARRVAAIPLHNHSDKPSEEAAQDSSDVKEGRGEMNTGDVDSWKCHPNWLQGVPRKTELVWAPDEETFPAVGRTGINPFQLPNRQPEKKGAETLLLLSPAGLAQIVWIIRGAKRILLAQNCCRQHQLDGGDRLFLFFPSAQSC